MTLPQAEARTLFDRLMENVRLMLEHHLVHADLSAYNVLYWEGPRRSSISPRGSIRSATAVRSTCCGAMSSACASISHATACGRTPALSGELWNRYERGRMEEMIDRRNQVAACDRGLCSSGSRGRTGRHPRVGLRR